ncbi:TPA: DUF262 domain-containing protein, partial [Klebsiella pneumoniae]|nr:DUF262 domain-containing protein [Klebsiella pneumoniae]
VLRYFTFRNNREAFKHDISDFLTEYMEGVSSGSIAFDYKENEDNFLKVFKLFNDTHGDKVFGRIGGDDKLQSNFNIYHFESLTMGIQSVIENLDLTNAAVIDDYKQKIINLKKDPIFKTETTGGGKNSPGPLRKRIEIAQRYFVEG